MIEHFEVNTEMASCSSFGEIYRYVFLTEINVCAKAYVLYADGANGRVCLCSELGSV